MRKPQIAVARENKLLYKINAVNTVILYQQNKRKNIDFCLQNKIFLFKICIFCLKLQKIMWQSDLIILIDKGDFRYEGYRNCKAD
jgi:hypothetical protein